MKKTVKIILSVLVVICLSSALFFRQQQLKKAEQAANPKGKPVVKIGVILPLTGDSADVGNMALKAIELAKKEAEKNNTKFYYQFIFEDDQFKAARTASIANKFIFKDKVNAIMTYYAPAGLIVNPLAQRHKILHMGNTWEDSISNGEYNFIQYTPKPKVIEQAIKYLSNKQIKKVAVISERRSGIDEFNSIFEDLAKKNNIETSIVYFNRGERDFRLLIQKLKHKGYDYFFVNSIRPEFDIVAHQLNQAGFNNSRIMGAGGDSIENVQSYEDIVFMGTSVGTADFLSQFRSEYNKDIGYGAAISYDLAKLLYQAYEANTSNTPSTQEALVYLNNLEKYKCANGVCQMTPSGFIKNNPMMRAVINGKYVVLEP